MDELPPPDHLEFALFAMQRTAMEYAQEDDWLLDDEDLIFDDDLEDQIRCAALGDNVISLLAFRAARADAAHLSPAVS